MATLILRTRHVFAETGEMFAIAAEGFRRTWDVRHCWREWLESDIGSCRIRNELDATETMAVNPVHRLVTPRLWAASSSAVSTP